MAPVNSRYRLCVRGPFRLFAPGGGRIVVSSKKGMALIAMLGTARDGVRSRVWLQDRLWGKRHPQEAQGSLRRELLNLRKQLNCGPTEILVCERELVKLALDYIDVDDRQAPEPSDGRTPVLTYEFLEGLDIAGEEGFEEWLREHRGSGSFFRSKKLPSARTTPGVDSLRKRPRTPAAPFVPVDLPSAFKDRPALAVLPFVNLTGDLENAYLCEGLGEDLIERLSRLRWLPVISRGSSFLFSGENVDRQAVSRELDAKYLMEGRLRSVRGKFVLNTSLTDASSNLAIWSQRLELPDPFSGEHIDLFVSELVAKLDTRIDHAEQVRARNGRRNALDVNDLIWRGRWHLNRFSREGSEKAHKLFSQALALDPESSEALIQATFCLSWSVWAERLSKAKILEMRKLAQRAILADCDDGRAHMLAGMAEMWLRKPFQAEELLRKAIELNPSLALAHAELGSCHILSEKPDDAIPELEMSMRFSPNDLHIFYPLGELAMAHCMRGEWNKAAQFADRALMRRPGYWYAQIIKITALSEAGDLAEADRLYAELMLAKPDFSRLYIEWLPFTDRKWTEYFVAALATVEDRRPSASVTRLSSV
jgi:TolB-like protein/tetratricopeptide (TPR) repeat protein